MCQKITGLKEYVDGKAEAQEAARALALNELTLHLHALNEWKEYSIKREATFVDIGRYQDAHKVLEDKFTAIKEQHATAIGSLRVVVGIAAILGGILGAITAHFLK